MVRSTTIPLAWLRAACAVSVVLVWLAQRFYRRAYYYEPNSGVGLAVTVSVAYALVLLFLTLVRQATKVNIARGLAIAASYAFFAIVALASGVLGLTFLFGIAPNWVHSASLAGAYGVLCIVNGMSALLGVPFLLAGLGRASKEA